MTSQTAIFSGTSFVEEHRDPTQIQEQLAELARIKSVKRDWLIKPTDLRFVTELQGPDEEGAVSPSLMATVKLPQNPFPYKLGVKETAHQQLYSLLGPHFAKYYQRLRGEYPELLAYNVNALLDRQAETRGLFVRELDGMIRAILSASFGVFDNQDLVMTVAPVIEKSGGVVMGLELTDDYLYMRALVPDWAERIERQHRDVIEGNAIFQQWLAQSPEGLLHRYGTEAEQVADEDWIIPGIIVKNSETGRSTLTISTYFLRVICVNGTTMEPTFARRHVSQRREIYTSMDTVLATQNLVWNEVKDAAEYAFNRDNVRKMVERFGEAAKDVIEEPQKTFDSVCENLAITEAERQSIVNRMITGGDPTRFGLVQAVTAEARDTKDADRKDELERAGGVLLTPEGARLVR